MIRKFLAGAGMALALTAQPVLAQDASDGEFSQEEMDAAFAELSSMFEVEPLTPEQEARLPLAREIMDIMMPEGTLAEVFDGMMESFMGPMTEEFGPDAGDALLVAIGYSPEDLGLTEAQAEEVLAIVDPAWRERNQAMNDYSQQMMSDMMTLMEPIMREAMAEVYAVYFTEPQLGDIQAFFTSDTGTVFARQLISMSSDPRLMAAMFEEPEIFMAPMMDGMAGMEAAMASVPEVRAFEDLSPEERAQLTALTGLTKEDLEYMLTGVVADDAMLAEEAEDAVEVADEVE